MVDCQRTGQLSQLSCSFVQPQRLVIATRESRLALWQAEFVRASLRQCYPACDVQLLGMTTTGDQILDQPLTEIGGKGLFTKELEQALLDGRADLAVHSLKDVPMSLQPDFELACVMQRDDPRDALVANHYAGFDELPHGARVGTSSLRRAAQLRDRRPDLQVVPLRGNLDTRLGKLDRGEYDAIVLAAAGLKRLGLSARVRQPLATDWSLPAPGQGALGIEIAAGRAEVAQWLAPLIDARTWLEVTAERAVSRILDGSCRVALAAYAVLDDEQCLTLKAMHATGDILRRTELRQSRLASESVTRNAEAPMRGALAWADAVGVLAAQALRPV